MKASESNSLTKSGKNRTTAVIISIVGQIIPFGAGAGQIYNGRLGLGIIFGIVQFINGLLIIVGLGLITTPIVAIYAIYHTYNAYGTENTDTESEFEERVERATSGTETQESDNKVIDGSVSSDSASSSRSETIQDILEAEKLSTEFENTATDTNSATPELDEFDRRDRSPTVDSERIESGEFDSDWAPVTDSEQEEINRLVSHFIETFEWLEDMDISFEEYSTTLECKTDTLDRFASYDNVMINAIHFLSMLDTEKLGGKIIMDIVDQSEDISVVFEIESEIVSKLVIEENGLSTETEQLNLQNAPNFLRVRGTDGDKLYHQWVLSDQPEIDRGTVNDRQKLLDFEIDTTDRSPEDIGKRFLEISIDKAIMSTFFLGKDCVYESVTFRSVSMNGERLFEYELSAEFGDCLREESGGSLLDLKDNIELKISEPETQKEAREQLLSQYQKNTSEQVVFQNGVFVDSGIDVVFKLKNVEQQIGSEAEVTDLSSKLTEPIIEIVSVTQSTFSEILDVDQIMFTLKDEQEKPFMEFTMHTEWITQHASNEIDTHQLIERTIKTIGHPEPETAEDAREYMFDRYRDVTSEQLVFQDGVEVDSEMQVTFNTPDVRERIGLEEGQMDLASKINERVFDSLVAEITELANITLNAYSEHIVVDQISFTLQRDGDETPTEFIIQTEWIEESLSDNIEDEVLIERIVQTVEVETNKQ